MNPSAPSDLGTPGLPRAAGDVPKNRTIYFGFCPSTTRYHRVFALAAVRGCSWQDVIRDAIDAYLARYSPENPV